MLLRKGNRKNDAEREREGELDRKNTCNMIELVNGKTVKRERED